MIPHKSFLLYSTALFTHYSIIHTTEKTDCQESCCYTTNRLSHKIYPFSILSVPMNFPLFLCFDLTSPLILSIFSLLFPNTPLLYNSLVSVPKANWTKQLERRCTYQNINIDLSIMILRPKLQCLILNAKHTSTFQSKFF